MSSTVDPYWKKAAEGLNERAYGNPNSMNAVRLRIAKDLLAKYEPGRLLDAGCGAGATTTAMLAEGWDVTSVDFSADMVAATNQHLKDTGHTDREARVASLTDLSLFPDNQFDVVICLGVMYYIEDDAQAYRELHRVLKPGGVLLCSSQNELFDLFTFNSYTRRFFKRHFFPLLDGGADERQEELDRALASLLTHPDAPHEHSSGSARGAVFTRQENPLTYEEKIASFGFEVVSGPHYHGIHLVPPILEGEYPEWDHESQEKQYALTNDWRGMFNAAHFLYELRKE